KINKQIYTDRNKVFMSSIVCTVTGRTKEELNDNIENLKSELISHGITASSLVNLQEEGVRMTLPYGICNETVAKLCEQLFVSTTLAGSFMHDNSSIKDDSGSILGKDENNNVAIFNPWKRDMKVARNNSNIAVIGESGVGKSELLKKITTDEYGDGTKVIVIDPEREYKGMCKRLDGQWINMAGGKNKINFFQIRDLKKLSEKEIEILRNQLGDDFDEEDNVDAFTAHMRLLKVILRTYAKDLTETEHRRFFEIITNLYKEHKIDENTDFSELTPDDYFIAEDVYNKVVSIQEDMRGKRNIYTDKDLDMIESIRLVMWEMAHGSDKELLNGKTNIELNSDFIVFDIFDLQNADTAIKRTQYFNILSYAFERLTRDRFERVLLIIDEAHILIDKDVIDTVKQLRTFQKRVRKYSSALVLATQEVNDFMHKSVKEYGVAILNNATYKFLMGSDGENLEAVKKLYKLTDKEENILSQKETGVALLIAGNKRIKIDIQIPDYIKKIIRNDKSNAA
ncbi:MAG: DUF87 domain-containing protein, partial [Clostridia bacterium]|nr:DUF87 domain-containing protein [Clostridia bacterium]